MIFRSGVPRRNASRTRFPIPEKSCSFPVGRRLPGIPRFPNAPERRAGEGARCSGTTQAPEPALAALSIPRLARAHHQQHTMNQLKLSLRAADDPRTIKEENGVPSSPPSSRSTTQPGRAGRRRPHHGQGVSRTRKTLVNELKKGVAFVVEGQLAYYKSPKRTGDLFDLGRKFHRHHPAKIHRGESQLIS